MAADEATRDEEVKVEVALRGRKRRRREKGSANGGRKRVARVWVRCGPRSTDSSWSYALDGQGRYTTPMYFRGVSLLDSYGSFLRRGAQRAAQDEDEVGTARWRSERENRSYDNERNETPGELNTR